MSEHFGLAFIIGAGLCAVFAVIYQRREMIPNCGSTFYSEIMAILIWLLASVFAGLGAIAYVSWYFAILIAVGVFGLSFPLRFLIERIPKRPE